MAIKNSYSVYIDGINYTSRATMPLKWGNFLDEQLDECHLPLRRVKKKVFPPLTPVESHLSNKLYFGKEEGKELTSEENRVKYFLVANDTAQGVMLGRGIYDHDLYLIEVTKYLECLVVDTITFTNDLGRNYSTVKFSALSNLDIDPIFAANANAITSILGGIYQTPVTAGEFTLLSSYDCLERIVKDFMRKDGAKYCKLTVKVNDDAVHESIGLISNSAATKDSSYTMNFSLGNTYEAIYQLSDYENFSPYIDLSCCFRFSVVSNKLPLKQWTITDVINRVLDLAEPLRRGEKPRFLLNGMSEDGEIIGGQAAMFEKIIAPQFSFTKQTLRECLKEIGKVIHGEPRITPKKNASGKYYYELSYDMFAQTKRSGIYARKYLLENISQAIDSYASSIDSNAENLVTSLDSYDGVIVEPFAGGFKSVRTEQQYFRITESNMIIATQYPIYTVEKLECQITRGDIVDVVDITPYLFESSVYYSQLAVYDGAYPYTRNYALYYTQGDKNIKGLNFKPEAQSIYHPENSKYAIVNIVKMASNGTIDIDGMGENYPTLSFRVTYTPIYNARVEQSKVYYKDFPRGAAQIYNQQANIIESRYYGENLKGAIARIGNVERSLTYRLARLSHVPKAGQMFDDDYYISAVSVEFLPTYIKCTVGLSKDFNRLSQYIGIPSERRFSEVSQSQAHERNILYREYIVIGDDENPDSSFIGDRALGAIMETFGVSRGGKVEGPITNVTAWGESANGNEAHAVNLPVVSSAFGNSISFSWRYEDNFSAGPISQWGDYTDGNNTIKGYFQNDYMYTDYYGRVYYYHFDLQTSGSADAFHHPKGEKVTTSSGFLSTVGKEPYILRKDNREILQVNAQIDFVTNRKDMIIGSALARSCPLIRGYPDEQPSALLYIFQERLDKFIDNVEGSIDINLSNLTGYEIPLKQVGTGFAYMSLKFPISGKAWAIVTPQKKVPTDVEDEFGEQYQQEVVTGGNVLLAQNREFEAGETESIWFTRKRKIYNETVWKDIR